MFDSLVTFILYEICLAFVLIYVGEQPWKLKINSESSFGFLVYEKENRWVGLWCIAIGKIGADIDVYWGGISIRFHFVWKIGPCYKLNSIPCSRQAHRPLHLSNIMLFGLEHIPWFWALCLNRWSGLFVDKINNAFLYILVRSSFHNFFPVVFKTQITCVV